MEAPSQGETVVRDPYSADTRVVPPPAAAPAAKGQASGA